MGYHPLGALRRIDRGQMHSRVQGLLDRLGVRLDPERPVRGLSIADQQIVEIAKALSFEARVLIMDEPTAALSGPEVERLFAVVRTLREEGAAVLFISHRLDEVFAICDTVTVMRDGAVVHDARIADMTPDEMVKRMVGRELSALFPKQDAEIGEPVLSVHRLTREGVFFDVSFEVRAGEIVALAGLVGAGRSEVARAIFGIDKPDAGHVEVAGRRLASGQAADRDARRDRLRARGPPPAGARHGPLGRPQRDDDADAARCRASASSAAPPRTAWRASGRRGCSSSSTACRTRRASSRAATSRRWCSPSGSRPSRSC